MQRPEVRARRAATPISDKARARMKIAFRKRSTPEWRQKLSEAAKRRTYTPEQLARLNANRIKHHTEESKRKISESNKGRKVGQEGRANIKAAALRRKPHPQTQETRAKIRASNLAYQARKCAKARTMLDDARQAIADAHAVVLEEAA